MASTPLLIGFTVEQPAGTIRANIQVTCRNENTNQLKTDNTASDGKIIFNLGSTRDFSDGWNVGDRVSVFSLYRGFEQNFSLTIPAVGTTITVKDSAGTTVGSFIGGMGMSTGTFILAETAVIPALRYYTSQEFLDYFDLKTKDIDSENGISLLQLAKIGEMVELDIDTDCRTKFDDNNGSYYSSSTLEGGESPEYHDVKHSTQSLYFTKFVPINSVTTFEKNNNAEGSTPDWETLTEAATDIAIDNTTGRVKIIDSGELPEVGARHVRITYTFGRSSVPRDIKQLAILETGMRMLGAAFIKSRIDKFSDTEVGDLSHFNNYREKVLKKYKNHIFLFT